ncbi:nucleotidyltransferase domain-containing protein [soil metagenome]
MRFIPDDLDSEIVGAIGNLLAGVAADDAVAIPWAIESGSRAWGFPSPDSDYDCRFLFVRSSDDYLTPWPKRDVIETPLDEIFDVNGWDLIKAIKLLLKGNAVIVEWLTSPIIYSGDALFRDDLLALASRVSNRALTGRHYLHVGRQKWVSGSAAMPIKKIFYSLRPAAALRWLRLNPELPLPPMNLSQLMLESDVPADVAEQTEVLIAAKALTRELGTGTIHPSLARFIDHEYDLAHELYEHADGRVNEQHKRIAADTFRRMIATYGPN